MMLFVPYVLHILYIRPQVHLQKVFSLLWQWEVSDVFVWENETYLDPLSQYTVCPHTHRTLRVNAYQLQDIVDMCEGASPRTYAV